MPGRHAGYGSSVRLPFCDFGKLHSVSPSKIVAKTIGLAITRFDDHNIQTPRSSQTAISRTVSASKKYVSPAIVTAAHENYAEFRIQLPQMTQDATPV